MTKELDNNLLGANVRYRDQNGKTCRGTIRAIYMKDGCPYCAVQESINGRLEEVALFFCCIDL